MKQRFIILAVMAFIISCTGGKTHNDQVEDIINAFILTKQVVSKNLELPAELLPYEHAELNAKVVGYVEKVLVDIGDKVKKGEALVILDAPEIAAQYAEAKAGYHEAEAKYNASADQYSRIFKASEQEGVISETELINSLNRMLADSAALISAHSTAQAYKQLQDYLYIRAPFDGTVTERFIDPGDLVGTSEKTTLLTVERPDKLRLRVHIPEAYVTNVPVENVITFSTEAVGGKIFNAVLARKSGSINRDTRTELWEYEFENSKGELKPGMYAMASLDLKRSEASFVVPDPALVTTLEKKFVIRIKSGQTEWIDVRDGIDTGKGVEIFGNLNERDTILARGSEELKPGMEVKIKMTEAEYH